MSSVLCREGSVAASLATGPVDWLHTLLFLPPRGSTIAGEVDGLHFFVILTTFVASIGVGAFAVWAIIRFRRSGPLKPTPHVGPRWYHEVAFVSVPLTLFLAWGWQGYATYLRIETPPDSALPVYVTGKQWMWKFAYPHGPNGLDVLRVPVGRPIRLLLTSRDVIHSFYVPAFRIKQDALPGRYTQVWFEAASPGRYEVLCAEFCGTSHSYMRAEVIAMPAADFAAWLAQFTPGERLRADSAASPSPDLVEQGRRAALEFGCTRCHTTDGTPHIGPTWLGLYGRLERLAGGGEARVDEAYLTESMMDPLIKVVAGFAPVMPTYQGQLDAAHTAAIVEYIKSLVPAQIEPEPEEGPTYELIPGR